jgi:tripartite-type tricarboxylate transporter receptor subunit TctC
MFKKTAALLATIISMGGAAGAIGALAPAAQARRTYTCSNSNATLVNLPHRTADAFEDFSGGTCTPKVS